MADPGSDAALVADAVLAAACPTVAALVAPIAQQLKTLATKTKNPHSCALQAKLGQVVYDEREGVKRFVPGVDRLVFADLLCRLEESSDATWSQKLPWIEIVDRLYLLPSGLQVRTTTEVTPDDEACHITTHVVETDISHCEFRWRNADPKHMACVSDVSVTMKNEETVLEDELQARVDETNLVRLRQFKTFRYTPCGEDQVCWSINLVLVWERSTHMEALAALRDDETPVYEVELECHHPYDYVRRLNHDYDRLALSMALKIGDFFAGADGAVSQLVPDRACTR